MNRKKMSRIFMFILILAVTCYPGFDEEKKEEKKMNPGEEKTAAMGIALDEKSQELLKYFNRVQFLLKKMNAGGGSGPRVNASGKRIGRLLKKASDLAEDVQQKEYLDALAAGVKSGDFSACASKWFDQKENKVDIIIKPGSGEKSQKLDMYILIKHPEYTEKAGKYTAILDKMLEKIPARENLAPLDMSYISPILVADVVFQSNPDQYMLAFPENSGETGFNKFKIVIFRNVLNAYFKKFIEPLVAQAFIKKFAGFVDFDSYLSNIIMHKLSFYLGPIFYTREDDKIVLIKDKLKGLFYLFDDVRAETTAISSTQVLIDEKLIGKEKEINIYSTYLVSLLRRIKTNPGKRTTMPALIQFNQQLKNGGVTFDLNTKKLKIEKEQVGKSARRLMLMITQFETSGNYQEAEKLLKGGLASPANELQELFKSLKKESLKTGKKKARTKADKVEEKKKEAPEKQG